MGRVLCVVSESWVYGWHEIPTVCCRSEFACAVEANVFDADGARALADAVTVNSTLQLLNLSGVFFLHFFAVLWCGILVAKTGSSGNGPLTLFRVDRFFVCEANKVGDDGARALADAIAVKATRAERYPGHGIWRLFGVDLVPICRWALHPPLVNSIGADGATALADALEHNGTLLFLDLFGELLR